MSFAESVPRSVIVDTFQCNLNAVTWDVVAAYYREMATELCKKYIQVKSTFEINISGNERQRLCDLLLVPAHAVVLTPNDLFTIFEAAKGEMLHMLSNSHSRFKRKATYAPIHELLEIDRRL